MILELLLLALSVLSSLSRASGPATKLRKPEPKRRRTPKVAGGSPRSAPLYLSLRNRSKLRRRHPQRLKKRRHRQLQKRCRPRIQPGALLQKSRRPNSRRLLRQKPRPVAGGRPLVVAQPVEIPELVPEQAQRRLIPLQTRRSLLRQQMLASLL